MCWMVTHLVDFANQNLLLNVMDDTLNIRPHEYRDDHDHNWYRNLPEAAYGGINSRKARTSNERRTRDRCDPGHSTWHWSSSPANQYLSAETRSPKQRSYKVPSQQRQRQENDGGKSQPPPERRNKSILIPNSDNGTHITSFVSYEAIYLVSYYIGKNAISQEKYIRWRCNWWGSQPWPRTYPNLKVCSPYDRVHPPAKDQYRNLGLIKLFYRKLTR